ncbi:MAG: hypothetical protein MUC32_07005 [Burkholderiaceae bacterium]|nr:hypothetical protein [Burkholderiaceae bacterium]
MNDRGVRIGIGFFGLPRSTPWTLPSLEQHLIEPARSLGVVDERYHLYLQQRVVNARSGEDGALSPGHYAAFEAWSGELESAEGVAEASGLARWSTYGDAYGDGFASLRNLLLQLHSLERLTLQFDADPPDLVVFVRPDLMLHDSLADDMREILARPVDTSGRSPASSTRAAGRCTPSGCCASCSTPHACASRRRPFARRACASTAASTGKASGMPACRAACGLRFVAWPRESCWGAKAQRRPVRRRFA